MELILGKKFKLEAWEICLQTMKVKEVSEFLCDTKVLVYLWYITISLYIINVAVYSALIIKIKVIFTVSFRVCILVFIHGTVLHSVKGLYLSLFNSYGCIPPFH